VAMVAWGVCAVLILVIKFQRSDDGKWRSFRAAITTLPGGIESKSEHGWSRYSWKAVQELHQLTAHIAIHVGQNRYFIIPKTALGSTERISQFVDEIQEFRRTRNDDELLPLESLQGEVLPGQRKVQYENSSADYAQVLFPGVVAKNTEFGCGIVAILIPILMAVWIGLGSIRPVTLIACLAIFFLVSSIATIAVLLGPVARFVWRRSVDESPRSQRRTLVISPEGMTYDSALVQGFSDWHEFGSFDDRPQHLILIAPVPHVMDVIPKSAFASTEECQSFVQQAQGYAGVWKATHEPNVEPAPDSSNPYQPPRL